MRSVLILIVCIGFWQPAFGRSAAAEKYQDLALRFEQRKHSAKAVEYFTKALAEEPDNLFLRTKRGKNLVKLGEYDLGMKDLNRVLKKDPKNGDALKYKAGLLFAIGKFEESVPLLQAALKYHKGNQWGLHLKLAQAFYYLKKPQLCFKEFEKSIQEHLKARRFKPPDEFKKDQRKLFLARAKICLNLGKFEQAIADLNVAMKYGDYRDELTMLRGDCYMNLKQYGSAAADYSKVLKMNPEDEIAYEKRARVYMAEGKLKAAVADATKAIESYPGENRGKLFRLRASIYKKMGRAELAKLDIARALRDERL